MDKQDTQNEPAALLRHLHGEAPEGDLKRNTIVVVDRTPQVANAYGRLLASRFPGYEIETASTATEVIARISGDLKGRIALVLAEVDAPGDQAELRGHDILGTAVRNNSDDPGLAKIPLLGLTGSFEEQDHRVLETLGKAGFDDLLYKPSSPEIIARVLRETLLKKLGEFSPSNLETRGKVISRIYETYHRLIKIWADDIKELHFYPHDREDEVDFTKNPNEYDAATIYNDSLELLEAFEKLKNVDPYTPEDDLGKIFHDLNNKISPLSTFIPLLADSIKEDGHDKDVAILNRMKSEIQIFANLINRCQAANRGRSIREGGSPVTWGTVQCELDTDNGEQKLEIPKGYKICVVDDDYAVRRALKRAIIDAGGIYVEADSPGALEILLESEAGDGINVFLLDHSLGRPEGAEPDSPFRFGHECFPTIESLSQWAHVIGHTAEIDTLKPDYRAGCDRIVPKGDLRAISAAIKELGIEANILR